MQIQLAPNSFQDQKGHKLDHIPYEHLKPEARGLVVVSLDQARRFLQDGKRISIDALALLTLVELPQEFHGPLEVQHLIWPGILVDTKDPVLIRGSCIQLGDLKVVKVLGPPMASSSMTPDLLRIMVYKDQWPLDWTAFRTGPLKAIVSHFESFQLCDGTTCGNGKDCGRFHPAVEEEVDLVVLDAFGWRWMDSTGSVAAATQSVSFSVMVRVPPSATTSLLALSAQDGTYLELRDPQGRGPHPKYAVIWTKGDYQGALHYKFQSSKILHIVRFHGKYGLRVLAVDHEVVHKLIHPKEPFVKCKSTQLFEVGPFPYGATKNCILAAISSSGWTAKPIRPAKGNNSGRFWILGAEKEPEQQILNLGDQHVTVTKIPTIQTHKEPLNIVASMRTLQKLSTNRPPVDPLQVTDPWATFRAATTASSSTSPQPSKLEEVTTQIKEAVEAQVREQLTSFQMNDAPMTEVDSERLEKLEHSISELHQQNQQYGEWFAEAGDRVTGLFNQVQRQEAAIEALGMQAQQTAIVTDQLQHQVGSLRSELKQDFEQSLAAQTAALEAMMSKNLRTE